MWIERKNKKQGFIKNYLNLKNQVLLLTGARQVGKTSFILNALEELKEHPQIRVNLLYAGAWKINGVDYRGRDFFGKSGAGEDFLKNIEWETGSPSKPVLIFVDEADQYPLVMESIQTLAEFSNQYKFVFTGSNLENISVKNAATGRKKYFDLYPITFSEFLWAQDQHLFSHYSSLSLKEKNLTDYYHKKLSRIFEIYVRLGGLPKLVATHLDPSSETQTIPEIIKDLTYSIEENVKTILGEKAKLYEYEDILRKLAFLSMNTLKISHLQTQHANRTEAKKIVAKTMGARVIHKIRLMDTEHDLSKYILFDVGLVNYLLNGSHLLTQNIHPKNRAIQLETFVGQELAANLSSRDDLFYWKSGNQAELEFMLRSPFLTGIDVKTSKGGNRSLASFALKEEGAKFLVKITDTGFEYQKNFKAKLPTETKSKTIPLIIIPHYLVGRLTELLGINS